MIILKFSPSRNSVLTTFIIDLPTLSHPPLPDVIYERSLAGDVLTSEPNVCNRMGLAEI